MTIPLQFFPPQPSNRNQILLVIGGDQDTKDSFRQFATEVVNRLPEYRVCTFSFTGYETGQHYSNSQQILDLEDVMNQLVKSYGYQQVAFFCTSRGAYSTCFILISEKYSKYINNVIFCDPADYYIDQGDTYSFYTWRDFDPYMPTRQTASDLLRRLKSKSRVNVVHFLLRNYGPGGYISDNFTERCQEDPKLYPRLNTRMVKGFYEKLPKINRGIYIEDKATPHAFNRDGNIPRNTHSVVEIISKCLRV